MNLLALVYTFGNPIHDIEKTTWILVVVVEIQRVLSRRCRTPSLGFAEMRVCKKTRDNNPRLAGCKSQYVHGEMEYVMGTAGARRKQSDAYATSDD